MTFSETKASLTGLQSLRASSQHLSETDGRFTILQLLGMSPNLREFSYLRGTSLPKASSLSTLGHSASGPMDLNGFLWWRKQ